MDPDSQQIGIAVNAALPAVMGNNLSAERRGLSDKIMALCFVQRITCLLPKCLFMIGGER